MPIFQKYEIDFDRCKSKSEKSIKSKVGCEKSIFYWLTFDSNYFKIWFFFLVWKLSWNSLTQKAQMHCIIQENTAVISIFQF